MAHDTKISARLHLIVQRTDGTPVGGIVLVSAHRLGVAREGIFVFLERHVTPTQKVPTMYVGVSSVPGVLRWEHVVAGGRSGTKAGGLEGPAALRP